MAGQIIPCNCNPVIFCTLHSESVSELSADERFDYPGGGFINLDIFSRAIDAPGVTAAQLIGEGCFHQLHGGTTTNVSMEQRNLSLDKYRQQFEEIRGHGDIITKKTFYYMGHLPTTASKIHRGKK